MCKSVGSKSSQVAWMEIITNNPKAEIFQSFFPDSHGMSVTVYLDGTVEWAPAK